MPVYCAQQRLLAPLRAHCVARGARVWEFRLLGRIGEIPKPHWPSGQRPVAADRCVQLLPGRKNDKFNFRQQLFQRRK